METELIEKDRVAIASASEIMVEALMTVPPARLRLLARWFEQSKFVKKSIGTEVQDDLRKMADLSEKALNKILNEYECMEQLE
jgi:hypothetical protein